MADFTVTYANAVSTSYSGEARHDLNAQSGVLTVFDGGGNRFRFSPSAWLSIADEAKGSAYEDDGLKTV